ncbi:MAG: arginine--tRNA ligase [Phycisphaerae bacterium]|nr:arginine--tRNA ligase [Phycisphaerae bacterium]
MKPIIEILEEKVAAVMSELAGEKVPAIVKTSQNVKFGDYQANGVMSLAKKLRKNPRELASEVVAKLDLADMCAAPEIAGPGFINLRLKNDWLTARLVDALGDDARLGVDPVEQVGITVIDYSAPNVAKQMHVGHLRSTIIGDTISRVLEFYIGDPDKVIRQNHIGDWGLQMGMVVWAMQNVMEVDASEMTLADLEDVYRKSNILMKDDPGHGDIFRNSTLKLQNHEEPEISLWQNARKVSLDACIEIYKQLNVLLDNDNVRGESFYTDKLPGVIESLETAGMLKESDGAKVVFMDGYKKPDGEPLPMIVQKSDGAFLYATTDLAAIRFRLDQLKADRVVYVTDARQKLHFDMVFNCAKQAGWVQGDARLDHVPFGTVLGNDNKPFKTRSGENIKLKELLDEAQIRAMAVVEAKSPDLSDQQKQEIAAAVGIGAVKYADLSNNLTSDYVFDWDKMLAMEGNTAPYMQYAYARVQSIFRKGEIDTEQLIADAGNLQLNEEMEIALAKQLLRFGEIIASVASELRPHILTGYLFDLAQAFSSFYSNCPVLKADTSVKESRLMLCYQTAKTIKKGLGLLGIDTIEQM